MKKKIVIFLLAVFLVFALLVSALCFFAPQKNQNSRENTTEQQKFGCGGQQMGFGRGQDDGGHERI